MNLLVKSFGMTVWRKKAERGTQLCHFVCFGWNTLCWNSMCSSEFVVILYLFLFMNANNMYVWRGRDSFARALFILFVMSVAHISAVYTFLLLSLSHIFLLFFSFLFMAVDGTFSILTKWYRERKKLFFCDSKQLETKQKNMYWRQRGIMIEHLNWANNQEIVRGWETERLVNRWMCTNRN